jgi:acetyl-CoA acyltransferase
VREAYIISAVRTATGRRDGMFKDTHPVDLAAAVLREVTRRAAVDPGDVEDVIMGCVTPIGEQGANIGRTALIQAGFPAHVPGVQINRMCGSSQQAVHFAAQAILAGDMDLVVAGGVEHMTRVRMGSDWPQNGIPGWPYDWVHQGQSAEMIAAQWNLTRDELDAYGFRSHKRAAAAIEARYFEREILPLEVTADGQPITARIDEGVRFDVDRHKMAQLKPAFKEDGVITAGNSSQISDGAAALLLASPEAVQKHNLTPRARLVARVVAADDPVIMLTAPIPATRRVLDKAGLKLADMDLIEINEAFASVVLAWRAEILPDMERVNVNGGAIANGHPLGATGAKIMTTLLHEMERRRVRYGLQTMCIGHGMATATILERV